jgi:ribonuclease HI
MAQAPQLTIHTDGASRGNPGPAAFAFVIEADGQPVIEEAARLRNTTNNQAEYTALVRALERALRLGPDHRLVIHSDSELLVKQMNGQYRVKDAGLRPLYEEAMRLRKEFRHPVRFVHVRREANQRADQLCNDVLDGNRPSTPPPAQPTAQPTPARQTVHQRAVARLTIAAAAWARGNAADPPPSVVWQDLWSILQKAGVVTRTSGDDSEE